MKKLLFSFLALTALLSSCSSDNDSVLDNGQNETKTKTYEVNLNLKSTGFDVDKVPLRSSDDLSSAHLLQVVIYKDAGDVYSDSIYWDNNMPSVNNDGSTSLKLNLPEGKYHLAILCATKIDDDFYKDYYTIKPNNYNTDYYSNANVNSSRYDNQNIYFETYDLIVTTGENSTDQIELMPMWSEIKLIVKNYNNINEAPSGTEFIRFFYNPHYYGFGIKDKLASKVSPYSVHKFGSTDSYFVKITSTTPTTFKYIVSKGADNSMSFIMQFAKEDSSIGDFPTLSSVDIKIPNKLENGYYYNISGDLGSQNPNQSLNISLGSFAKDDVNIEF